MHQIHDNFLGVKLNTTIFLANSSSFEMVRSFTCSSRVKVLSVGRLGLNDHFSILPYHFIFNLLLKRYGLNDPFLNFARPFDLAIFLTCSSRDMDSMTMFLLLDHLILQLFNLFLKSVGSLSWQIGRALLLVTFYIISQQMTQTTFHDTKIQCTIYHV